MIVLAAVAAYAVIGAVSLRLCVGWMHRDLAEISPPDDHRREFVAIYGLFFCALLWPIGFPVIFCATHGSRRRAKGKPDSDAPPLLVRIGSWGER